MRQLLIEAAWRRHSHKRGGNGSAIFVTLDESLNGAAPGGQDLLALYAALTELGHLEPRQAAIVEARFFGGLETGEISTLLNIAS